MASNDVSRLQMKNVVFVSPNFPTNYWQFCRELKNNGMNVLGIGEQPYDELTEDLKNSLPKLPGALKAEYMEMGLSEYDASLLTETKQISDYFTEVLALINQPKLVANFIINETLRKLKETSENKIDAKALSELLKLVDKKEISTTAGKQVFEEMWNTGDSAESLVEKLGLKQMNNDDELKTMVEAAISANPQSVADYKGGKTSAIGFLVGQVMKASKGKANPQKVNEMLKSLLD
jgi:aspartyl-tRNA(Asn)/glutamyl-tRNA(Gln) amidotransferase subunit B